LASGRYAGAELEADGAGAGSALALKVGRGVSDEYDACHVKNNGQEWIVVVEGRPDCVFEARAEGDDGSDDALDALKDGAVARDDGVTIDGNPVGGDSVDAVLRCDQAGLHKSVCYHGVRGVDGLESRADHVCRRPANDRAQAQGRQYLGGQDRLSRQVHCSWFVDYLSRFLFRLSLHLRVLRKRW